MASINAAAIPILGVPAFLPRNAKTKKATNTINLPAVRASGTSLAEAGQYPSVATSFYFSNQTSPKGKGICNPCNSGCGDLKSACCGDKNIATAAAAIFAALLFLTPSDNGSGSA